MTSDRAFDQDVKESSAIALFEDEISGSEFLNW